jgi:hypothetical protein
MSSNFPARYRRLSSACALVLLSACGGAAQHPQTPADLSVASLYPLAAGYAWSYDVDSGDGQSVLAVMRVARMEDGVAEVTTGAPAALRYAVQPDGITHADTGGHLLLAPIAAGATWASGLQTTARVTALHTRLVTPAGTFSECVVVEEANSNSGQRITTTYCPGVGPAQVISEMTVRGQVLRVQATLRGYALDAAATPAAPAPEPAP